MVLSFGLVTGLLLGSWVLLKPGSEQVSPGATQPVATEPAGRSWVTVTELDPADLTEAEAQARQRNLDLMPVQPNPVITALREAVGPQMSEEDLKQLSRTVNLLCQGTSPAEAEASLIEGGMPSATAKAVIEVACIIS
jgi:hypothetical protein